jgi:hypothetical protein
MAIVVLLLALTVIAGFLARSARLARHGGWLAEPLPPSSHEASALVRYLSRHVLHRRVGATVGVVLATVAGIRLYGEVNIGIGTRSPLADVLFCGLAGSIVGMMSAETFRLKRERYDGRSASLVERTPLVPVRLLVLSRALTIASCLGAVAILVATRDAGPLAIAAAGVAVAGVAEATRRAITSRPRPVMTDRARWVDDRMRWFAQRAVGNLQLAAAWLLAGWVVSKAGDTEHTAVDVLQLLIVLGCLAAAVVHLLRASPRRPRGWVAPK